MPTITIIGGGESANHYNYSTIKGDVMVVNGAITLYPDAKYFIALDGLPYKMYAKELSKFNGVKFNDRQISGTKQIPQYSEVNLSGYSAIRTAQELGYDKIQLIGFDAYGKINAQGLGDYTDDSHQRMINACKDMDLIFLTKSAIKD